MDGLSLIMFMLVIIFLIVVGIRQVKDSILCTYRILAKIESIRVSHNDNSVDYLAKCSYMYKGRPYVSEEVSVRYSDKVGDQIYIYINPYNPRHAIKSRGGTFVVGMILLIFGLGLGTYVVPQVLQNIGTGLGMSKQAKIEKAQEEARVREIERRNREYKAQQKNQPSDYLLLKGKKREYDADEHTRVTYFDDLIIYCPPWVTEPVRDDGKSDVVRVNLYNKGTGDVYLRIFCMNNKQRPEDGIIQLRKWVSKNVKSRKFVKRFEKNDGIAEIYSSLISNKNGQKQYRYYAILSVNRDMYIFVFNGNPKDFIEIIEDLSY